MKPSKTSGHGPEREYVDYPFVWQLAQDTAAFDALIANNYSKGEPFRIACKIRQQLRVNGLTV